MNLILAIEASIAVFKVKDNKQCIVKKKVLKLADKCLNLESSKGIWGMKPNHLSVL